MRILNPKFKILRVGMLKNLGLVFICLWSFFIMLGYMIPLLSVATYATLGVGLSQAEGAAIQAVFAAGQLGELLVFWVGFLLSYILFQLGGRVSDWFWIDGVYANSHGSSVRILILVDRSYQHGLPRHLLCGCILLLHMDVR
jgi:hypothetical protein